MNCINCPNKRTKRSKYYCYKCSQVLKYCPGCNTSKTKDSFLNNRHKYCNECNKTDIKSICTFKFKTCVCCEINLTNQNIQSNTDSCVSCRKPTKGVCKTCLHILDYSNFSKRRKVCNECFKGKKSICIGCNQQSSTVYKNKKCRDCTISTFDLSETMKCIDCDKQGSVENGQFDINICSSSCTLRKTCKHCVIIRTTRSRNSMSDETVEHLKGMLEKPCVYCGSKDNIGIDRIISHGVYSKDNCLPCCKFCNHMRGNLSVSNFLQTVDRICTRHPCFDNVPLLISNITNTYKPERSRRKYPFDIVQALIDSECYFCGDPYTSGVDRKDSQMEYTLDNCISCCTWCNLMKLDYPIDSFISHMHKIKNNNKVDTYTLTKKPDDIDYNEYLERFLTYQTTGKNGKGNSLLVYDNDTIVAKFISLKEIVEYLLTRNKVIQNRYRCKYTSDKSEYNSVSIDRDKSTLFFSVNFNYNNKKGMWYKVFDKENGTTVVCKSLKNVSQKLGYRKNLLDSPVLKRRFDYTMYLYEPFPFT